MLAPSNDCSSPQSGGLSSIPAVGGHEQLIGHCETERLRGVGIDGQRELCRQLHRKVGRLLALEDAVSALVLVDVISPIGDQSADA
jgi:hypothetical protein